MSGRYGQVQEELLGLQTQTPEQRRLMLEAGVAPERLREFERTRDNQEAHLRGQMDRAYQIAASPIEARGSTTASAVANLVANALRSFGGFALASNREKQLGEAEKTSAAKHEALLGGVTKGRGAALDVRQRGLSDALRRGEMWERERDGGYEL